MLYSNVILRFLTRKMINFGNLELRTERELLPLEHDVYIQRVTEWLVKVEIRSL